ncbi:zinc finger protein 346-like isoform X1 [Schistocerca americana]|uniref:zinc finger protein 346-like isoform X1 n=1 Tax=Schistocerca americana TaxID=7009 RepID=UPI001F4F54A9|nr:zinc finger protein 346-like isoform X1 [Schistocerca americana]XP_049773690.1 zinc finger protein 346-like isoform X2 [Schistocerca cancellata]XP_049773691.1 zinc finger protein 346-like isoform X2 [Schistocerca cancellata]XP_049949183.1 zinc finger protein 346-like isoform X1 [Schistocerca serialis cubense]XP_049949185.1 zinc finger protein 346-like isoform X1 [Schistocerca serialis cubense]XP_049949186.1 zinc finger protein 346-like isoform X1 [Schistocerca serialis cubense]
MSFYRAPLFPAVATVVNYSAPAVPLSQPVVTTMPIPAVMDRKPIEAAAPSFPATDPVTKAVMDNIMGKLPTKKQAGLKCEICGLEFSGMVVLETHLAGAKHAKKVKSQEILKQLQSSGQTFTRDEKTRILRCEVCDVVVNSSQQLQTHLAGNKHKQKVLKKGITNAGNSSTLSNTSISSAANNGGGVSSEENKGAVRNVEFKIPPGVHKLPDGTRSKVNKYYCDTCSVSLNSEIQLEQHLSSRKHKDRLVNGKGKPRSAPYWKRGRPNFNPSGKPKVNRMQLPMQYSQPLNSNIVSGTSTMI